MRKTKLSAVELRQIRSALKSQVTQIEIAARFNLSQGYISKLKKKNFYLPTIRN